MGFLLSNITAISEEDETFDFEAVISMHWQDSRLAYDPELTGYDELYYQGAYQFNEVFNGWWPQIILTNEAGRFDRGGVRLRVTPQGDVYYTEDIDAIAKSHLKLRQYRYQYPRTPKTNAQQDLKQKQAMFDQELDRQGFDRRTK